MNISAYFLCKLNNDRFPLLANQRRRRPNLAVLAHRSRINSSSINHRALTTSSSSRSSRATSRSSRRGVSAGRVGANHHQRCRPTSSRTAVVALVSRVTAALAAAAGDSGIVAVAARVVVVPGAAVAAGDRECDRRRGRRRRRRSHGPSGSLLHRDLVADARALHAALTLAQLRLERLQPQRE